MKIILVQIYRFSPEAWLLREMDRQFRQRGYNMVLWSNREYGSLGLNFVPLMRGEADELLVNIDSTIEINSPRYHEWSKFVLDIQDRYGKDFPEYDANRCYRISTEVFNRLRPALYLCWCGMNPWFAIPKEIANERNIPVLTWEAGMLPQTVLLDQNGVCADSQYVNKPIPCQDTQSLRIAEKYIKNWKLNLVNNNELRPGVSTSIQDIKVLVLGSMDSANGVIRPLGCGSNTLPGYKDGIDLAIKISETGSWKTIYRPHPNEPTLPLGRLHPTKIDVDSSDNLLDSILSADVVVGYGSKTDFIAIAVGKPFVMAGLGLINGKGCAYEALDQSDLAAAISDAYKNGQSEMQKANFVKIISWMLTKTHYNRIPEGPCEKGVSELVRESLSFASTDGKFGSFDSLLSLEGEDWLKSDTLRYQLLATCYLPKQACYELNSRISELPQTYTAILDFDHTLYLGNSTERFLLSVHPRLWGETIDKSARCFWNHCGRSRGSEIDRWRVLAAFIFAPWSLLWWNFSARKEAQVRWNEALEKAATVSRNTKTVIVSLGFSELIQPLVNARYKRKDSAEQSLLVCSSLFDSSKSLRKLGKVRALESAIPEINWSECFAVSDSDEDRDLLLRCRKGFYLQWDEPVTNPRPGYFPFRFLERGKFRGRGYLKHSIVEQDFVVWIFAYGLLGNQALPALLFFLSLHSIYEIGYYENDYLAAKSEKNPTLFFNLDNFNRYPIDLGGWSFGLLTAGLGIYTLHGEWNSLAAWKWLLLLILLRTSFAIYNRLVAEKRLPCYVVLQAIKNFGGVLVMTLNPVGLALAVGHAFQHISVYQIYRCGGDKEIYPRSLMRTVVYILGVAVIYIIDPPVHPGAFAAALAWCGYQIFLEKRGYQFSIVNLAMNFLFRLPLRLFRKAQRKFLSVLS